MLWLDKISVEKDYFKGFRQLKILYLNDNNLTICLNCAGFEIHWKTFMQITTTSNHWRHFWQTDISQDWGLSMWVTTWLVMQRSMPVSWVTCQNYVVSTGMPIKLLILPTFEIIMLGTLVWRGIHGIVVQNYPGWAKPMKRLKGAWLVLPQTVCAEEPSLTWVNITRCTICNYRFDELKWFTLGTY